ncbi:hypothetical protein FKM82_002698 [Ascaphus truei]
MVGLHFQASVWQPGAAHSFVWAETQRLCKKILRCLCACDCSRRLLRLCVTNCDRAPHGQDSSLILLLLPERHQPASLRESRRSTVPESHRDAVASRISDHRAV